MLQFFLSPNSVTTFNETLTIAGVAAVSLANIQTHEKSLSVDGVAAVSLANIQTHQKTLSIDGIAACTLTSIQTHEKSLSIDGIVACTLTSIQTHEKSLSIDGISILNGSTTEIFVTLTIAGISSCDLANIQTHEKTFTIAGIASCDLANIQIHEKTLTIAGVAAFDSANIQVINQIITLSSISTLGVSVMGTHNESVTVAAIASIRGFAPSVNQTEFRKSSIMDLQNPSLNFLKLGDISLNTLLLADRLTISSSTASNSIPVAKPVMGVQLIAPASNTGAIYIGDSNVTSVHCYPLAPGDSIFIPIDKTDKIHFLAEVNNEFVHYLIS